MQQRKIANQFQTSLENFNSTVNTSLMKQEQSISNAKKVLEDKSNVGSVRSLE